MEIVENLLSFCSLLGLFIVAVLFVACKFQVVSCSCVENSVEIVENLVRALCLYQSGYAPV